LRERGYKRVAAVFGGLDEMPKVGFPVYIGGDIWQKKNGKWYKNAIETRTTFFDN